MRVAIIGDRGIPARYSGFSNLVEEISTRFVAQYDIDTTVYCRTHYFDSHPETYRGVRLVYLPAPGGKSFESLWHSTRAILHASVRPFDVALVLDPGNGPLTLPLLLRRVPFVIHTDGLGWQRRKWGWLQRRYYRWSEWVSARLATALVCDSRAMCEYYAEAYRSDSTFIPYGGTAGDPPNDSALKTLGLEAGQYHLVVARLEPENNVDLIIREYKASRARLPLVYVGGARYESEYSRRIFSETDERVKCVGPIYESAALNGLYRGCRSYLHGHEVGGTNPSLLRAMAAGAACIPIDVVFHREVMGDQGLFFGKEPGALAKIIEALEDSPSIVHRLGSQALDRTRRFYRWDAVAAAYAEFLSAIVESRRGGRGLPDSPAFYRPEEFTE